MLTTTKCPAVSTNDFAAACNHHYFTTVTVYNAAAANITVIAGFVISPALLFHL